MKKVFASLLGVVVFFLLVPTCTILIARDLTSEKTIGKILDVAPELIDENTNGDSLADAVIEEVEAIDPAFADLLDEERLQEELVKIVASMLEAMGDPTREQMVDVTSLKEYLREVLNEYVNPDTIKYQNMVDEICKRMKFNSLKYHRIDDLIESIGLEPCKLCTYCFDGKEEND